jgi:hypothetical protein
MKRGVRYNHRIPVLILALLVGIAHCARTGRVLARYRVCSSADNIFVSGATSPLPVSVEIHKISFSSTGGGCARFELVDHSHPTTPVEGEVVHVFFEDSNAHDTGTTTILPAVNDKPRTVELNIV